MLDLATRFSQLWTQHGLTSCMSNVKAQLETLSIDGLQIPVTVVDTVQANCYVVSPYSMIIDYGRDELVKLPIWRRQILHLLLNACGYYLRYVQIDKVQTLNNYCLSTNLFSQTFQESNTSALTQAAIAKHPEHSLIIRSLNEYHHPELLAKLQQCGWQLLVNRQVYLFNDMNKSFRCQTTHRDQKLLQDVRYIFQRIQAEDHTAFTYAQRWYEQLYIQKYSDQNVQFTAYGLQQMVQSGILELYLLYDQELQRSVAVVGLVQENGIISSPIVGYDLSRPQNEALYRRIMAFTLQITKQRQLSLNLSSGAPLFKRLRGGQPQIEYAAVYYAHLAPKRRRAWNILCKISHRYYAKWLKMYEL